MGYDCGGMPVQGSFEDHFVVGIPQHRTEPEGYVDRFAESSESAQNKADIVQSVPCCFAHFCAA